jgi:hypothetical protein
MRKELSDRLTLFIEKSDLLQTGNFLQRIRSEGLNLNLKWDVDEGISIMHNSPEGEPLQALAITFRMFIQNNDSISFGKMSELLNDPEISQGWKDQFSDVRTKTNSLLDSPGDIALIVGETTYTLRQIIHVFLYGELAHSNAEKRAIYQEWKNNPIVFYFAQNNFSHAIIEVVSAVSWIAQISRFELQGIPVPPVR